MKKLYSIICLSLIAGLAACGGSEAYAQTLETTFQFGGTKAVNIAEARVVDLTPGAQQVVDRNGNTITGAFLTSPAAFLALGFVQANYVAITAGGLRLVNLTQVGYSDCVAGQTAISWLVGPPATIADNCNLSGAISARSKRQ